jgi:nitrite reductase/ring-hydroxylating ferredoxin subunit
MMDELHEPCIAPSRRGIVIGAGALCAGAVLTACGGASSRSSSEETESSSTPETITVSASAVPVGGGTVLKDAEVVVTQPQAGQYHAFSTACTHKQCLVNAVNNDVIECPCHGSRFSATDGSVVHGPTAQLLSAKTVTVEGETLTVS